MGKRIRARLIEERKQRNWSQQEVADRIGTTQNNVSRWELGLTTPGAYFSAKLCELFGKSTQELELLPVIASHDGSFQRQARDGAQETEPVEDAPEAATLAIPCYWHVPYARNPFFTGRDSVLQQLHLTLHRERAATLSQSYALSGLGGIGKTQTAIEYAYRYANDYTAVLWVNAETGEQIASSFVAFAELLHLPEKGESEQKRVISAVTHWLTAHDQWLLIFDNVEDTQVIKGFVPPTRSGALLFTSRKQALGIGTHTLDLEKMLPAEGLRFLLHRARLLDPACPLDLLESGDRAAAREIVSLMDGLPLALDQAGAYIEATCCSLADYLSLLRATPLRLLDERETYAEHPQSVTRTFVLAFEQLEQKHPQAAELLMGCSFLAPAAIPETLFLEGATHLGPAFEAMAADPLQFQAAMKALLSYSLIQRQAATHTLTIHRLVQAVLQGRLPKAAQHFWARRLIHTMSLLFPAKRTLVHYWQQCEQLLPHALVGIALGDQWDTDVVDRVALINRVATYFWNRAQLTEAEALLQRALSLCESALGSEHLQTADSLLGLANIFLHQGKYEMAEQLYLRNLYILERTLGPEHLRVATPLNNLACLYLEQGRYGEVEALYQRAFHIRKQALTEEHPLVASSCANLATLYQELGKYEEAETLFARALVIAEQTLGPEDPQVAFPLAGLATIFLKQGKYSRAETLFARALLLRQQTLGPEHPLLADMLNGLATLYRELGKYEKAEEFYQRAVHIRQEGLGAEHPEIAEPLYGLATLYRELGKYEKAEVLYQRAFSLREKGCSAFHPLLAEPLYGLARLYSEQKQYERAEMLYQRALRIWEQALGSDHPRVSDAIHGLAHLASMRNCQEEAERLYERALHIREQKLGSEHPLVAETLQEMASLSMLQGKYANAYPLYQRALAIHERTFGAEHTRTAEARAKYAKLPQTIDK